MSKRSPYRKYIDPHRCIWVDSENRIHVDAPKLLKVMGLEDTPENNAMLERELSKVAGDFGVPTKSVFDL